MGGYGEGTEGEAAQREWGVRDGLENSIWDSGFDGAVLCRVRKLKGPGNEGCGVQRGLFAGCRLLHPEVEQYRVLGQIVQTSFIS
jgi:hypothetical protein